MHDLTKPYWTYESCIRNFTNVSIRAYKEASLADYYDFFGKFISYYADRIISVSEPIRLLNGSMVSIINLSGRELIHYSNQQ